MSESTKGEGLANESPIDMDEFRQDMKEQDLEDLIDELIEAFVGDAPSRFDALLPLLKLEHEAVLAQLEQA